MAKTTHQFTFVANILVIVSLLCSAAMAAEAPAPSPTSASSPAIAGGVVAAVTAVFFGSILKICRFKSENKI
ncbi:hypothetical protein RND81_03G152200 [Saponaria officinalis]|uniref:Transmembrane protein n=1 Tax=Saponaria officinalis TaxID=3572 RepID=A0AAW1M7U3_SAPOF